MYERFTDRARKAMQLANQEAQRFNHKYIGTEHILLGVVKEGAGVAANVLKNLDIDLRRIRMEVEKIVQSGPDMVTMGKLPQTPKAKKVIEYAIEEARTLNHNYVGTEHLLLGLLREEEGVAAQVLLNLGLKLPDIRLEVLNILGQGMLSSISEPKVESLFSQDETPARSGATSTLSRVTLDLSQQAKDGKLGPIVGRQEEMEHILMVLACRSQNNPILVGPPGVGKSAIVKGLAIRSASDHWPATLFGRRILAFNLVHMIGLTLEHGNFGESFEAFIKELRRNKHVILFIDDLLTLTGVGNTRASQYAFCAFRSGLARGQFQCITLATLERYQSEVATDSILARHLQPVFVKALSAEETLQVLLAKRDVYEGHHRAEYKDDALTAAIELSELHWPNRCLPGKALQLLDQAGALVRLGTMAPPPDLKELETRIDQLNQQKEEAVAEQDFDRAGYLRDEADKLKKQREASLQEWNRQVFGPTGKVDKEAVAEVIRKMVGLPKDSDERTSSA
jgi:ATP-dependent Clp protease ATP-binding subunit ClpC